MPRENNDDPNDARARLDEVKRELAALPPDVLRQAILDAGLTEVALDTLADLARNAENEADRTEARRIIDEYGLGLILFGDEEPPTSEER